MDKQPKVVVIGSANIDSDHEDRKGPPNRGNIDEWQFFDSVWRERSESGYGIGMLRD